MAQPYVSLAVDLLEESSELGQSLLYDSGAESLEIRDSGMLAPAGVRWPAPGQAILVAYFSDRRSAEEAREQVLAQLAGARVSLEDVEARDWSESWKDLVRAVELERLWVGPPWLAERAPAEKVRVVIEPKMAFGTGDHPTTTLCLTALEHYLSEHPGASVLDVGTGTGVLAIAARKLGASRAVGIDNDEVAIELAKENVALNGVPEVELPEALPSGQFDLVLANIVAGTLVELAPELSARVGDHLALSGVLSDPHQIEEVAAAYKARGLSFTGFTVNGEWARLDFTRPH